jgi:hypothetical protein
MPSFNWIPSPKRRLTSSTSGASDRSRSPSDAVYPTPTPAVLKESTNASDERPTKKSRWSPRKLSKPAKRKGLLALEAAKIMDTHLAEADGLRDELVRTRTEIDAERRHSQEERERDRARIVGLERTLVAQAREMQDVKTRAAQTQQRSDSGEAIKALVKALQDENALWGKELELSRTRARELEEKLLRQTRALEHLRKELAHTKAEQARTDELLKTRTWELQGAESFLTKADAISGAEVIAVVEGLNVEIFQAAAHMADSFSPEFEADENPAVAATPEEVKTQRKLVLDTFGEPLVHFLQKTKHNEDPIVIQVAFQAGMAICAQMLVQNWYPFDARINTLLSSIHESAQKTGDVPPSPIITPRLASQRGGPPQSCKASPAAGAPSRAHTSAHPTADPTSSPPQSPSSPGPS